MSWLTSSFELGLAPLLLLLCAMKIERNSNRENEMNILFHKHFHTLNTFFLPHSSISQGKTFFFFLRKTYKFYLPSDCPDLTPSFADLGVENAEISQNVIFSAWRDFAHSWAQLLPPELLFVRFCKQFQVAVNCRTCYLINHFKTCNA